MMLRYAKLGVHGLCFFGEGWVVFGEWEEKGMKDEEAARETVLVGILSGLLR